MKYLSVCSGIEAASVAWAPLNWEPVAFSEIEKFPCAVLKHHYPHVQNLGDMTKFKDWDDYEFDILVGGTPCQSFSVAGLRKGLADPRGNLMLTYLAIANRYRPRVLVWENVPGVLSMDKGRAFGTLIQGMEEIGYHAAWRVLDAQYIRVDGYGRAVPQRRRRVFVVGYLGDWRRAAAILFDAESMSGNPPPSRKAGKGFAREFAPSLTNSGRGVERTGETRGQDPIIAEVIGALNSVGGHSVPDNSVQDAMVGQLIAYGGGNGGEIGAGTTLSAKPGTRQDFESETFLVSGTLAPTLDKGKAEGMAVATNWAVRRLMPIECERLQGFPDGYTDTPYRGKNWTADGPRYKALGNSMAVNAMRWLGRRIEMADAWADALSEAEK